MSTHLEFKQVIVVWLGATVTLLLAWWITVTLEDRGFVREPNDTYDYVIGEDYDTRVV